MTTDFLADLWDIIELTYAYRNLWNNKYLNKTLFEDFINLSYEENSDLYLNNFWEIYKKTLDKLTLKIEIFDKEIKKISNKKQKDFKDLMLSRSLKYSKKLVKMAQVWLIFEAKKFKNDIDVSQKEISKKLLQLKNLENKLFDWKVKINNTEIWQIYNILNTIFTKNHDLLSNSLKNDFKKYLNNIKKLWKFEEKNINFYENKNKNQILNINISRENYIEIFKLVFKIYQINKPIIIEERSSIYDWEKFLSIPNNKTYDFLTLNRVLELICHEIETHYLIEKNNFLVLWNFRWEKNLFREEWLAKFNEWILNWYSLDDFSLIWAIIDSLAWEILTWKNYKNFLDILKTLDTNNSLWLNLKDTTQIFLRRKRNYDFNKKWVQHKDCTYSRWTLKVVDFLKNSWDYFDLYLAKISFEDITLTKDYIIKNKINILKPIFVWEILKYILLNNNFSKEIFLEYLYKKCPYLKQNYKTYFNQFLDDKKLKIINKIINLIKQNG